MGEKVGGGGWREGWGVAGGGGRGGMATEREGDGGRRIPTKETQINSRTDIIFSPH